MTKAKKKPEDETLEQNTPDATPGDADESEPTDEPEVDAIASDEPVEAVTPSVSATPLNLQHRITLAARAVAAHGGQEKAHALNQLELLTGRVKMALPAAIAAVEDEDLKAGLKQLLALL